MSLRSRLERLGASATRVRQSPQPVATALDDLRQQMSALLGRGEVARPAAGAGQARAGAARVPLAQLPFVRVSTPWGELWQRTERLAVAHHVGRVAVDLAASAQPQILAELALDPAIASCDPRGWLFLDTETTGLGGAGTLAFLVGMAGLDASGSVLVEQLLVPDPSEETAMLARVAERVREASLIVSFNGKAFDRPLLESRNVMNRLPALAVCPHLDLLHVGRRLHRQRLGSCTLKRMESEVLGFERGEDIEGSQVGPMYTHFLRTADASGLALVVAHNFWDVTSMVALVALYGQRLPALMGQDLAGLARTLRRAGATSQAELAAHAACERGGGVEALRVRAELAKLRGDCWSAVRDLELLCQEADDPAGRLELAKLYEHKIRRPLQALHWVVQGTGEEGSAQARRRARLERKIRRISDL